MNTNNIKAVVFDMDGTLLDSREFIYQAMETVLAQYDVAMPRHQLASVTGKPVRAMYELLVPDLPLDELESAHFAHHAAHEQLLEMYDGAHEVLGELLRRQYKLGIFTGFDDRTIDRLRRFALDSYFDSISESSRYKKHKPDPEGLFICMQDLGVSPQETAYIGDGVFDMLAGKAAGVARTIGISHGFASSDELYRTGADMVIDSLYDVPSAVQG